MVATKISEVAGKGWGWYAAPTSNETKDSNTDAPSSSSVEAKLSVSTSSSSLQKAAQSAYSGITNAVYSSSLYIPSLSRRSNTTSHHDNSNLNFSGSDEDGVSASSTTISGLSKNSNNNKGRRRRKSVLSPTLLTLMDNPYIGVRGGGRIRKAKPPHESMDAIRKLLYVVDDDKHSTSSLKAAAASSGGDNNKSFGSPHHRQLSSQSVHFDQDEGEYANVTVRNKRSNDQRQSESISIPLTPSRAPISRISTNTSSNDSSTATPRHRNSGTFDSNLATNTHIRQQQTELPMPSVLQQQHPLATIESMPSNSPSMDYNIQHTEHDSRAQSHTTAEKTSPSSHSPEETASQLTEGTLRALRDLALDEALELHASLKYWSDRWERPVFSWFVAGPLVWFGWISNTPHCSHHPQIEYSRFGGGYNHAVMVGQRVSQIQAVLARRLSVIGELQDHLLRSGWQRGVAQWSFLGEGGNWIAVDGTDGRMLDEDCSHDSIDEEEDRFEDEDTDADGYEYSETFPLDLHHKSFQQHRSPRYRLMRRDFSEASVGSSNNNVGLHIDALPPPPPPGLTSQKRLSSGRISVHDERRRHVSTYYTNLHVRKRNGGHIQKDDQALAEWSIDALALIRSQLIRAANGKLSLPYSENWPFEHVTGNASIAEDQTAEPTNTLTGMPVWAGIKYVPGGGNRATARTRLESRGSCFSITEHVYPAKDSTSAVNKHGDADTDFPKIGVDSFSPSLDEEDAPSAVYSYKGQAPPQPKRSSPSSRSLTSMKERAVVGILNLPLMTNEVSSLLDVMEDIMDIQRARRLEKLKPPSWWRQHWFLVVMGPPSLGYLLYNNLIGRGQTWNLVRWGAKKLMDFAREHVVLPCVALYDEFTKGQVSITDHAARDTATETLKKMIRSWLDETYPKMEEAERARLSDAMDITLIEESKEQSMKSAYNLNSVIRMSFIEAQFIKKEMMNALVALDEMQASTNFNMNLAAITPFVLLMWTIKKVSRFVFYTAFKWGKSRKETYRSFLDALTEIERLLIMRSNPPSPSATFPFEPNTSIHHHHREELRSENAKPDCVLESDDLGMLMLHIHELRTILWQERRRFSPNALRSVSEDLAELSGERGAVSVRQQLLIVERMNRAYSFLKQGAVD